MIQCLNLRRLASKIARLPWLSQVQSQLVYPSSSWEWTSHHPPQATYEIFVQYIQRHCIGSSSLYWVIKPAWIETRACLVKPQEKLGIKGALIDGWDLRLHRPRAFWSQKGVWCMTMGRVSQYCVLCFVLLVFLVKHSFYNEYTVFCVPSETSVSLMIEFVFAWHIFPKIVLLKRGVAQ